MAGNSDDTLIVELQNSGFLVAEIKTNPLFDGGKITDYVNLSTDQTIDGEKTFLKPIVGDVMGNSATVTTNANLTGEVTSVGNASTVANSAVIAKVLTGFTSGAGIVSATDSLLSAVEKLDANVNAKTSTTQEGYNVSTSPQITTDATRKAVVIKNGDALDTDNVLVIKNIAGTDKFKVTGDGDITANKLIGTSVESPTRLDFKKDTLANLTTYALTASNGQTVFSTDTKEYLGVLDGLLVGFGGGGGGSPYADELISSAVIDWSLGTTFYKSISADTTFTFSNIEAGKTITVVLYNSAVTKITVTLPSMKVETGFFDNEILATSASVFTFASINGAVYGSSITGVN